MIKEPYIDAQIVLFSNLVRKTTITGMKLEEFRGVRKMSESINLRKFNVLVGRNNSCKTTILEAIALLPNPGNHAPMVDIQRLGLVGSSHGSPHDFFVYGYAGQAKISYVVNSKSFTLLISLGGKFEFESHDKNEFSSYRPSDTPSGEIYRSDRPPSSISQVSTSYYSDHFYDTILNGIIKESEWKQIEKTKAHNKVLKEVINPSIAERFTEVLPHYLYGRWILQARKEFPDGTSGYVRINDLGRGLQRVIVPLLWFEGTDPSIVLWDDLEAGMHPSLLDNVLKWLSRKEWQVVISTHSMDVLSAVAEVHPNDCQVLVLRKSPDDQLQHQTLEVGDLEDLLDTSQDPRRLADLLALR